MNKEENGSMVSILLWKENLQKVHSRKHCEKLLTGYASRSAPNCSQLDRLQPTLEDTIGAIKGKKKKTRSKMQLRFDDMENLIPTCVVISIQATSLSANFSIKQLHGPFFFFKNAAACCFNHKPTASCVCLIEELEKRKAGSLNILLCRRQAVGLGALQTIIIHPLPSLPLPSPHLTGTITRYTNRMFLWERPTSLWRTFLKLPTSRLQISRRHPRMRSQ